MTYQGSCHCGRTRFEAQGEIGTVIECNCMAYDGRSK